MQTPHDFKWLLHGELGGMPTPGSFQELELDLAALQSLGVTRLLSLTREPLEPERLQRFGLHAEWFPMLETQAPSPLAAFLLCRLIDRLRSEGHAVAVHCRSGRGCTGGLLAAYLIYQGSTPDQALQDLRLCEPRWLESNARREFFDEFAEAMAAARARRRSRMAATEPG
jgi:atypical dual specificity phosphatase